MLIQIPDVLTAEQVTQARQIFDRADWVDGRVTAGPQSARTKDNQQLPEDSAAARELGQSMIRDDGARTLLFDLDASIQRISRDLPDHPSAVQLTGIYHNLVRRWAEL